MWKKTENKLLRQNDIFHSFYNIDQPVKIFLKKYKCNKHQDSNTKRIFDVSYADPIIILPNIGLAKIFDCLCSMN